MSNSITYAPIGYVENSIQQMLSPEEIGRELSRIQVREDLFAGLLGLEEEAKLLIVFHFDRVQEVRLQLHPRDDLSRPLRGVFATRTQYRPNPIGVTVVDLISVQGNIVTVRGLDAMDGTPVLDIKPYAPAFDAPEQANHEAG